MYAILIRTGSGLHALMTDEGSIAQFSLEEVETQKRTHRMLRGHFPYQVVSLRLA